MNDASPLDCGSGCRGFDPRYSPEIKAETPRGDSPQCPLGASPSAEYSPNIVQSPISNETQPTETDSLAAVEIPLGKSGRFALVDACDAERVRQFRWHLKLKRSQPGRVYAQRSLPRAQRGTITNQALHSFIMGAGPGQLVDHENGNGLDNRRSNLRFATRRENATNVTSSKRQKLGGYKGVSWNKAAAKWQASICGGEIKANGKRRQLYLGVFADPVAAARAYDSKALEVFGPFASLNFADPEAEQFAIAMGEAAEVRGLDLAVSP
jgi:hypothetical protein